MNRLASLVVVVAGAAVLSACQTATDATPGATAPATPAAIPVASGPARVEAEASLGCPGRNAGPAFLIGSRDLASSSAAIGAGQSAVSETLVVSAAEGAELQIGSRFRPTAIGNAFEMCVITSPPARGAALSAIVSGQLQTTRFASDADNAFWQGFFDTYFVRPLQLTPTDANGVLKIDVLAGNLRMALASAPSSSGEMLITVSLPDGAHQLSLTVEKQ
jgi:hypothetical protein